MRPKTQDSDQGFALQFFVPASPPPNVEFGAASHQGLVRKTNEDHFGVFRRTRAHEILMSNLGEGDRAPLDGDETAIFGHVLTSYTCSSWPTAWEEQRPAKRPVAWRFKRPLSWPIGPVAG